MRGTGGRCVQDSSTHVPGVPRRVRDGNLHGEEQASVGQLRWECDNVMRS